MTPAGYGFLPLPPEGCRRTAPQPGTRTGRIDVRLVPLTDLFLPDPRTCPGRVQSFCCTDPAPSAAPTAPILPAASLRGMLRERFAAETGSCLAGLTAPRSSRSLTIKRPGIVRRDGAGWVLQPAVVYHLSFGEGVPADRVTQKDGSAVLRMGGRTYGYGARLYVQFRPDIVDGWRISRVTALAEKRTDTCRIRTALVPDGRSVLFFAPDRKKGPMPLPAEVLRAYHASLEGYAVPYGRRRIPDDAPEGLWAGVWYDTAPDGQLRLSPAAIGRDLLTQTPADFAGSFAPCTDRALLCPACALFGMTDSAGHPFRSRLRVTDGVFAGTAPVYAPPRPIALHAPHPGAMAQYTRTDLPAKRWSYDAYRIGRDVRPLLPGALHLRGRKVYRPTAAPPDSPAHTTLLPLAAGEANAFTFTIWFDQLDQATLDRLLDVMTAQTLRLGRGRPLGMGAVRLTPQVTLRHIEL